MFVRLDGDLLGDLNTREPKNKKHIYTDNEGSELDFREFTVPSKVFAL